MALVAAVAKLALFTVVAEMPLVYLFIYLLCHIYPGVPHQCATLFSLGLLQCMM